MRLIWGKFGVGKAFLKSASVLVLFAGMALPSWAGTSYFQMEFVGADAGDWGGKKGAVIGLPDNTCANMGAVNKTNLVSDFGFQIPNGAVITGVTAWIKAAAAGGQPVQVQLASNAAVHPPTGLLGNPRNIAVFNSSSGNCADTDFTSVNGGLVNWGNPALTPTIVNNSAFGLVFEKIQTSEVKVDAVCLEIDYTSGDDTNHDQVHCNEEPAPGTLTLQKTVSGGGASPGDWELTATGNNATTITGPSGVSDTAPAGDYTLTESGPEGYTQVGLNCVGGSLVGNVLTLNGEESAVCGFENAAPSTEIPTMSLWMLILLVMLLSGVGLAYYSRRTAQQ